MTNKYYQKHKEKLQKEVRESIKIFPKNKKNKGKRRPDKDLKILLKKKKKKSVSSMLIVIMIFLRNKAEAS